MEKRSDILAGRNECERIYKGKKYVALLLALLAMNERMID